VQLVESLGRDGQLELGHAVERAGRVGDPLQGFFGRRTPGNLVAHHSTVPSRPVTGPLAKCHPELTQLGPDRLISGDHFDRAGAGLGR
jgi:hypothetical protein